MRRLHLADGSRTRMGATFALGLLLVAASGCAESLGADPSAHVSLLVAPVGLSEREVVAQPQRGAHGRYHGALVASPAADAVYVDTDESALTEFRDALEPYGAWEDDPSLGTVWFPSRAVVGASFVPYVSAGRWTYDSELLWVSDYAWGWAPFHYGRWAYAGPRGWAWIPGRRYAGAWVDWRTGEGSAAHYVGWGPTPPSWYWRDGDVVRITQTPAAAFVYCPVADLFAPSVQRYLVNHPAVLAIASQSYPYTRGVATNTERAIRPFAATDAPTPDELGIADGAVVRAPSSDPGLQRAWMLARPSTAETAGVRPRLPAPPPHLKTWVAGAPRYYIPRPSADVSN